MGDRSKAANPYFGKILKQLRTDKGLTQSDIGKIVNKGDSTVRMWELRNSEPDYDTIVILANYFNVSVDYLLGRETKSPSEERKSGGKWIPVYGRIAAGIPIEAIEDIIDYEELPEEMLKHGEYIALQVKGDSMEPRISEGDTVIIRLQDTIESGEVAAVYVNGNDVTLKRVRKEDNGIWLIGNNPSFTPIFYSQKQCVDLPVRILGKMVELRGKGKF